MLHLSTIHPPVREAKKSFAIEGDHSRPLPFAFCFIFRLPEISFPLNPFSGLQITKHLQPPNVDRSFSSSQLMKAGVDFLFRQAALVGLVYLQQRTLSEIKSASPHCKAGFTIR